MDNLTTELVNRSPGELQISNFAPREQRLIRLAMVCDDEQALMRVSGIKKATLDTYKSKCPELREALDIAFGDGADLEGLRQINLQVLAPIALGKRAEYLSKEDAKGGDLRVQADQVNRTLQAAGVDQPKVGGGMIVVGGDFIYSDARRSIDNKKPAD